MKLSVFFVKFADGQIFESNPCEWLDEAITQSGRTDRPVDAAFMWGDVYTWCTQSGIDRAMEYVMGAETVAA